MKRPLSLSLATVVLALTIVGGAGAGREPTAAERLLNAQATLSYLHSVVQRDAAVSEVRISSVRTPKARYTAYSLAVSRRRGVEPTTVLLGLRRGYWYVLSWEPAGSAAGSASAGGRPRSEGISTLRRSSARR